MSKLVLIDGNAILHRAYHALPPMFNRRGEPTNAIYGFVSMLLRIIQDLKPTHIVVCFDREEPTFRRKMFSTYQTQRKPTEDNLSTQFKKARELTKAFHIPSFDLAGYEADDLIGTIASRCSEFPISNFQFPNNLKIKNSKLKIDEVVIVTGDRDQYQLVNDKVKLYMPITGLTNAVLVGEKEVEERMGVGPERIIDYKALVGDPSDNYPGVPGIGPKTAVNLLIEYGSLETIYKNLDKISQRISEKLKKGKDSALLSQKLAKIIKDVPIKFDLEEASKWNIDSRDVDNEFNELGFRTLAKRVKEVGKKMDEEKQGNLF
jgi:DNA polymerase I